MPNKKEIKVLQYLNGVSSRYDNNKKGDTEANIKTNLHISNDDIGDMHYSEFLQFSSKIIDYERENGRIEHINENIIVITHEGSVFIENYHYERIKEFFYWVFGIAAIIAAIFAILAASK